MLDSLIKKLETVSRWAVWAGGAMLIFAALMVTVDVAIRASVGKSMGGSDEISGYLLAVSTSWAFAYALLHRVNVRIDALYLLLGKGIRAALDVFGLLLLTGFVLMLTWRALQLFLHSYNFWGKSITPMQTPLAIPQFFWLAGLVLFAMTLVVVLLRCALALAARDPDTVLRVAGARSQTEELEEEIHLSERRPGADSSADRSDR